MNPFVWSGGLQKCGTSYLFYDAIGTSDNYTCCTRENKFDAQWRTKDSDGKAWKTADLFWEWSFYHDLIITMFRQHAHKNSKLIFLIRDLNEQFESWHWNLTEKHKYDVGGPHRSIDITRDELFDRDIKQYKLLPNKIDELLRLSDIYGHTLYVLDFKILCKMPTVDILGGMGIHISNNNLMQNWKPHHPTRKVENRYDELDDIYNKIINKPCVYKKELLNIA
jgi:hypothetical protein